MESKSTCRYVDYDMPMVGFVRLDKNAELPRCEFGDSIGYDLIIPDGVTVKKGGGVIPLGFSVSLPKGVGMFVVPRSGAAVKGVLGWKSRKDYESGSEPKRFDCEVRLGLVDPGYSGEVGIIVKNNGSQFYVPAGSSFAQAVFIRTLDVAWDVMETYDVYSERGAQGFCS